MTYDLTDKEERTTQAQKMLRYISFTRNDDALRVPINGIFDAELTKAVRYFQEKEKIPVTGTIDSATWNAITDEYTKEKKLRAPVYIDPIGSNELYRTQKNEKSDAVVILQVLLNALSEFYNYELIPITGIYTPETAEAVAHFQKKNNLPITGEADRLTWHTLAEEFNLLEK